MTNKVISRHAFGYLFISFIVFLLSYPSYAAEQMFRSVIVLVPDGCGSTHTTAARWYKGGPLALDRMALGGVRTYSADSLITDSAPAATAFATGHKSSDKFIGVLPKSVTIPDAPSVPEQKRYAPVATVLEGAKLTGRSVGIVVTSNVQDATPAAFSAHWPDRSNYNEIAEQQVYLGVDVVFGGGEKYLLPEEKGGTRTDGENLIQVLRSRGYAFVETREEMMTVKAKKVWGIFADDDMAYTFDRPKFRPQEPTLVEMTRKAIQLLSKNPKGFFLFVEGSKVDRASHFNDPIGVISEVLAFDDAVGAALDFAKTHKDTLVLAFADHGNGGMSIGNRQSDRTYSSLPYDAVFAPLKKATLTGQGVEKMLAGDISEERIRSVVAEYYGIDDLKPEEIKAIQASKKGQIMAALGPMASRRANIGWTTTGHTGEDVFFYHYGYKKPVGMMENTAIAGMIARAMRFDLGKVSTRLFRPAEEIFSKIGATVRVDRTSPENPVLVVEKAGKRADLAFSKDTIRLFPSGREYIMESVTILAPETGKAYVPMQAVTLFKSAAEQRAKQAGGRRKIEEGRGKQ